MVNNKIHKLHNKKYLYALLNLSKIFQLSIKVIVNNTEKENKLEKNK